MHQHAYIHAYIDVIFFRGLRVPAHVCMYVCMYASGGHISAIPCLRKCLSACVYMYMYIHGCEQIYIYVDTHVHTWM